MKNMIATMTCLLFTFVSLEARAELFGTRDFYLHDDRHIDGLTLGFQQDDWMFTVGGAVSDSVDYPNPLGQDQMRFYLATAFFDGNWIVRQSHTRFIWDVDFYVGGGIGGRASFVLKLKKLDAYNFTVPTGGDFGGEFYSQYFVAVDWGVVRFMFRNQIEQDDFVLGQSWFMTSWGVKW